MIIRNDRWTDTSTFNVKYAHEPVKCTMNMGLFDQHESDFERWFYWC